MPGTQLDTFLATHVAKRSSLYSSVNSRGESETPQIYNGQSGDALARTSAQQIEIKRPLLT